MRQADAQRVELRLPREAGGPPRGEQSARPPQTTTTVGLAAQSGPPAPWRRRLVGRDLRSGMPIRLESGVEMAAMRPRAAAGGGRNTRSRALGEAA